jgi:ketosteroid isomerase-like protein
VASDQEQANVELVRRMWDAFNDEGLLGILAFATPDARWQPYSARGRVFETTAEYRAYIEEMVERDEVVEPTLCDVKARGDHVLVNGRIRVRGPGGLRDTNLYWVHRVREGKIVFTASFPTPDEALAAAGLRPGA